jgi:hypothetical protein
MSLPRQMFCGLAVPSGISWCFAFKRAGAIDAGILQPTRGLPLPELPFIVDRRPELKGRAMTHALFIGVSRYDHIQSLDAGAHTAIRIYEWLRNADDLGMLTAPLGTVTLLLSPTKEEQVAVDSIVGGTGWAPATGANILAARERLRDLMLTVEYHLVQPSQEIGAGTAIYYFGGHGADFFREDPIGLASDFNDQMPDWVAAFDQLEYRERLTRIEADELPSDHSRRMRCLFLYDCCRTRGHGGTFDSIKPQYDARTFLAQPAGVRPYLALSAATEAFPAWEPVKPIDLPPRHGLPLSFFGHALLNAIGWSQDHSNDPKLPWQTSARGLVDDLARAVDELAKKVGIKLPGAPGMKAAPPDFALVRSRQSPKVVVVVGCDPEAVHCTKTICIQQRVGSKYEERNHFPPWTKHPESCTYVPGMFLIEAVGGGRTLKASIKLRPAIGAWQWIIRDDAIAFHDPAC